MTDEQLSALLRLKRYEQPPAHYFEGLLQNVHRRQRADLLQLPLWKIAVERVQTFFGEHSMSRLSYAGAMASVLVLGVTTIGLMTPGGTIERDSSKIAEQDTPSSTRLVSLEISKTPTLGETTLPIAPSSLETVRSQPRYVIDMRPVSYEQSSSINF
jgi:hypothetical protein